MIENLYRPLYSPWFADGEFAAYYRAIAQRTLVSPDRCFMLYRLLLQALHLDGDVWECGVYKGGTAAMFASIMRDRQAVKTLRLFDTFSGMPETDAGRDLHKEGDFADTSATSVLEFVGAPAITHTGYMPDTFAGRGRDRICFAHIDVDIYRSVIDCLAFVWPRLTVGGFLICDDYGFPSCPGAREAVDEFFAHETAVPLCIPTGQAIVFKS